MRFFLSLLLFIGIASNIIAQTEADSLSRQAELRANMLTPSDSIQTQDSVLIVAESDYPNPKKAALLGLAIPGAGHVYNKRGVWWKLPATLGALGGAIYAIDFNGKNLRLLQDAYCAKLVNSNIRDPLVNPCDPLSNSTLDQQATFDFLVESSSYTATSLRSLRDRYDRQYQLSWIGLVIGHLVLNGAWSFVDAHLNGFDLNDDLSIHIQPHIRTNQTIAPSSINVAMTVTF